MVLILLDLQMKYLSDKRVAQNIMGQFVDSGGEIIPGKYIDAALMKEDEKSLLMRRLWPNPNEEDEEPGGILAVIAEDIDAFEVRYFDGEEWSDEWPEDMDVLPQLLEINIVAAPSEGTAVMESFIVNFTRSAVATAGTSETGEQEQGGQPGEQPGGQPSSQPGDSGR